MNSRDFAGIICGIFLAVFAGWCLIAGFGALGIVGHYTVYPAPDSNAVAAYSRGITLEVPLPSSPATVPQYRVAAVLQDAAGNGTGIDREQNESWFISIDPVGNYYSGDTVLIRGSTNIPVTETLLLEVYSSSYRHQPRNPFTEYGTSRTVTILPGRDGSANYWLAEITTTNWSGDEYLAAVSWITSADTRPEVYASQLFTILPAINRKTENSLAGIATLPILSDQPDMHVTQTRTAIHAPAQPAALPGIIPPAAIGGIIATVGLKKIRRVK